MTPRTFNNGYSGKTPGFHNMIFFSLIIHFVIITVILISVPTATRHLTFGPVYDVQLVGSEVALPGKQQSSLMKEIERSSEASGSIIYKRQIEGLAATPTKKEEANKLNVAKAVSAIKEKQLSTPDNTSSARAGAGPAMAARTSSGNFDAWQKDYSARTKLRVTKNFNIPPALLPRDNIQAIIAIKILRDGTLDYAGFEKKSGNRYFDDAALKAIKKSVPFAPFPEGIKENSIEIGIIFHPSQFR